MRVLLINPWESKELPPPSIGYLQSALKWYGIDVVVKDLSEAMADNEQYDITGVSFHSFSVKYARQIRDKIKGHLICGGHHPSALPEQMLLIGYDQVVIGEGENAIIDIINGNRNNIVKDVEHKYFPTINDLPFPDYTGFKYNSPHGTIIVSSRGCPFDCCFCGSTNFWHHKWFMRSANNVIKEIEQRKKEGFNSCLFHDDNFLVNKERVKEICSHLDKSFQWECQARAESLTDNLCKILKESGCRKIHLGIESLSQEALNRMNKKTTVEKMLKGVECANNAGIATMSLFIVGLPGDSFKDIEETHRNRIKSRITQYGPNICWILPKTAIYEKAKEYGFNDNVYLESGAPFYTYEQSFETLTTWSKML
ncbi:MAG: radical SAM protein [Clostridia bacterium]|jgi:anaerobic magnesium-protoporphyrin IX monomethyl ester cyclase